MHNEEISFNLPTNVPSISTQGGYSSPDMEVVAEEGMVLRSADGTICACNASAERILGYTLAQIQQCSSSNYPWQTIHEDGSPFPRETHPAVLALQTGKPCLNVVMGLYKPSGELIWLLLNSQPLFQANETSPYAVATRFTDITEKKRLHTKQSNEEYTDELTQANSALRKAEAALGQSEKQFRLLAENIPETVFWIGDLKSKQILYVSPAYEQIWGRSCSSLYANSMEWIEAIHPDERKRIHTICFEQILAEGFDEEYRIVRPDGSIRWIRDRGFPVTNHSDQFERVVGIAEDITERKQAEEALRESELNFRNLADTMPQMFWTTRPDGYHEYFNQRWYEYTGMTLKQTQGWGWSHLLHSDDRQRCLDIWNESLRTGKDYNIEYRFRRASDGQYRWFLGQAFPLRDRSGQIIRWFGSCTDIHDQKCAIFERDQALERERIARAAAEAANRVRDEFLAVLSHELRSPLNPILGWAKLLQKGKVNEQSFQRGLQTIERNAQLQTRLIEDLLDVSRILRGKLTLNVCPVSLEFVISAALETVRLAAQAKEIQLITEFNANIGQVLGDATRLQQVVWNLLSNAVKFTPQGGRVEVRLGRVGSIAQIQVIDTGKGISPDFLPHIFDYFRQEDSTITRRFGGLGLGLAIVRNLAELHGGTVKAESPGEGLGATFTVSLPLVTPHPETLIESKSQDVSVNLNGIKVLVVDDDTDSRDFVVFVLEEYGATVNAVSSASQVLQVLGQTKPDVLVSDIGMPEMDGYAMLRQIRTWTKEQGGQIPAIALTAYAGEFDQQQAIAAGFQIHIPKPVEPDTLAAAVVRLATQ